MSSLELNAQVIDVRDIIARVEELRDAKQALRDEFDEMPENAGVDFDAWVRNQSGWSSEESDELTNLEAILGDLAGNGGDEQWEGDWYPVTLIADWYFTEYAQELVSDIGDLPANVPGYIEIDWEATARNIRMDYTSAEIDGATYWYR